MRTFSQLILPSLVSLLSPASLSQTLCRADSVVSYNLVMGISEPATIEYLSYDDEDSLVRSELRRYVSGSEVPYVLTEHSRKKVRGKWVLSAFTASWDEVKGQYGMRSVESLSYDKKGKLLSREYGNEVLIINAAEAHIEVEPALKINYTYDGQGHLLSQHYARHTADQNWLNESKLVYSYDDRFQNTEIITQGWDTLKNEWQPTWRNQLAYDSTGTLKEAITYEFLNGTWVPRTRAEYGLDTAGTFKYHIAQKWDGAKSRWMNEFYYIMKLDENGKTVTEVHLSWKEKEWKIDQTYHYQYNDAGEIARLLNDQNLVIMERYCR